MMKRIRMLAGAMGLALTAVQTAHAAHPPAGLVAAASHEGRLVIYSSTDAAVAAPLLRDFQSLYPAIKVEYLELNSTELYNRISNEAQNEPGEADVAWSGAMDLQFKLLSDGYAMAYKSTEASHVPDWANWKGMGFATTAEPAVIVYNKRMLPESDVPHTHAELTKLLRDKGDQYRGRVASYDPERSALGFLIDTQDSRAVPGYWEMARALGRAGVRLHTSANAILDHVASGDYLIGYNVLGSLAMARAKKDPTIGIVCPRDNTLTLSRVAFITRYARDPNAARLWIDYLLSKRGQSVIAAQTPLFPVRADAAGDAEPGRPVNARPVHVGNGLLYYLDAAHRLDFLRTWQQAMGTRR